MKERKPTPLGFISALPVSPPDPVGSAVWHSAEENQGDLIVKGDQIIRGIMLSEPEKFLRFALPPIGPVRGVPGEEKEESHEKETEEEKEASAPSPKAEEETEEPEEIEEVAIKGSSSKLEI